LECGGKDSGWRMEDSGWGNGGEKERKGKGQATRGKGKCSTAVPAVAEGKRKGKREIGKIGKSYTASTPKNNFAKAGI